MKNTQEEKFMLIIQFQENKDKIKMDNLIEDSEEVIKEEVLEVVIIKEEVLEVVIKIEILEVIINLLKEEDFKKKNSKVKSLTFN